MRLELGRVTPAAVLRQQVYRFVPTDLNPTPGGGLVGLGMPPLGAGAESGLGLGMPSGVLGLPIAAPAPQGHVPSFAQHVQQQKSQKGIKGAGVAGAKNYNHPDHPSQDVLLRELFPGWF